MRHTVLSIAALLALLPATLSVTSGSGRIYTRPRPPTTTQGTFPGTWYYASVGQQFAFFVRFGDQGPELKVRWESTMGERYETDWQGQARYVFRGFPMSVSYQVDGTASTTDRIVGTYQRRMELEEGDYRLESGTFELLRAYKGRHLLWTFPRYTQEYRTAGKTEAGEREDVFYILRRASDRVVVWDDIPW